MQPEGEGERVVATDRDQGAEPELLDHPERVAGVIAGLVIAPPLAEEQRLVFGLDPRGVRSRRVEECPAGPIDRPNGGDVQRDRVHRGRQRVREVDVQQTRPTPADAQHLMTLSCSARDHGLDACVESGDVAAAREDTDLHGARAYDACVAGPLR